MNLQDWSLIIATGPSLRRSDCDLLRGIGHCTAVNNAVFYAPWADVHYAGDLGWWEVVGPDADWFKGERVSHEKYKGARQFTGDYRFRKFGGNSGHQAVQYRVWCGGRAIALLGFDHQRTGGQAHVHGDHPAPLGQPPDNLNHWINQMNVIADDLARMGVPAINLSRQTALTCLPRMTPEAFIRQYG